MATRKNDRAAFDAQQIARAKYFTACKFLGQGKYDRREAPTQDEAERIAREMGGAMIYAVTPENWSIHIRNV
jgi:hypothetical protein